MRKHVGNNWHEIGLRPQRSNKSAPLPLTFSISSLKPMSSIWSASSRMMNSASARLRVPRPMWSSSRPGVPTTTSSPHRKASSYGSQMGTAGFLVVCAVRGGTRRGGVSQRMLTVTWCTRVCLLVLADLLATSDTPGPSRTQLVQQSQIGLHQGISHSSSTTQITHEKYRYLRADNVRDRRPYPPLTAKKWVGSCGKNDGSGPQHNDARTHPKHHQGGRGGGARSGGVDLRGAWTSMRPWWLL